MKNCLNLGSGLDYRESTDTELWHNVDCDTTVKADFYNDGDSLAVLQSDFYDVIYSHHSLEHFNDLFTIVDEMARVSKDKATWEIITPYCTWTQNWGNPHHKLKFFHENTFRFFDKGPNGIHKRRQQDYSIETVGVEYGFNLEVCMCGDSWINEPEYLRKTMLNAVKQITYKLKCKK